ncbi:hypothetical protein [Sulfurovum mangrovi]|uniref:hypothetical protein n=1 Tax=Sulfurovum mangrovi TaxID=2893889 RepID=UPI001E3FDA5B|nr:hypothetical protein [Sulfurovum mangrovi]UFH58302.1 hypothetical protein LN246_08040 [Sulfurovum mangrovi]
MTFVGFEQKNNGKIKEYLPYSEQLTSDREKRIMFFHLFNAYVGDEMKFSKKEMHQGKDIYEVFRNKIENMLFIPCIFTGKPPVKIRSIEGKVSQSINQFTRRGHKKVIRSSVSMEKAAKWIDMIRGGGRYRFLADLDDMFLHLVYERAKMVNKENRVLLYEKSIVIENHSTEVPDTLLIPSYHMIDQDNLSKEPVITRDMQTVFRTLNHTKIRQIYLVYPKHTMFKKHISVKMPPQVPLREEEYRVKVIPYSFSFCAKQRKNRADINALKEC